MYWKSEWYCESKRLSCDIISLLQYRINHENVQKFKTLPFKNNVVRTLPYYTTMHVRKLPFLISNMVFLQFDIFQRTTLVSVQRRTIMHLKQMAFCFQTNTRFLVTQESVQTLQSFSSVSWQVWYFYVLCIQIPCCKCLRKKREQ